MSRAHAAGLSAIALTDHDTLAGLPAAQAAGDKLGLEIIGGCEFSVAAPWGEMHVLGYFLEPGDAAVEGFLEGCRADRARRGAEIVERLRARGIEVTQADLEREARGGAIGRPHVARALLRRGVVKTLDEAFARFLGWGRPAFVEKRLPRFSQVANLVHAAGGVVSAAHLRERGTRAILEGLKSEGLDAVETRHPVHGPDTRARLTDLMLELDLVPTGGSDWHGDGTGSDPGAALGGQRVPAEWLERLRVRRPVREPPEQRVT